MTFIKLGSVRTFPDVQPDRAQALKVLEEASEWEDKWERPVRAFSSHKTACECAERRKMRNRLQARWDDLIDYVGSYVISVELIEEVEG